MRKDVTIDTAALPAPEAEELHRLVQAADLPSLAGTRAAPPDPRARDQFHYRLTVEDHGQRHTVTVSDPNMPAEVRPLITWLHARSTPESS